MSEETQSQTNKIQTWNALREFLNKRSDADVRLIVRRASLRVLPLVQFCDRQNLELVVLTSFRAAIVSQFGGPTVGLVSADIAKSVAKTVARNADDTRSKTVANAVNSLAYAAASSAYSEILAYAANAIQAAVTTASVFANDSEVWTAINRDCISLIENRNDLNSHLLWQRRKRPSWFVEGSRGFKKALSEMGRNWTLIDKWYDQVLEDASIDPFPQNTLHEIANASPEFWGDGDDNPRTPDDVMADIAERLGWGEPTLSISEFILAYLEQNDRPVSIDEFVNAFAEAGYETLRPSIRGRLNTLTDDNRIRRVGRGIYQRLKPTETEDWPQEISGVKSPFEYGWSEAGKIKVTNDGLGAIFVPEHRSPEDAKNRLEAARALANELASKIFDRKHQVNPDYASGLREYAENLPIDHTGNIYLADSALRNLRDDLADDLKSGYVSDKFARRLKRVIEAHYGLRVYFPDLLGFYDDVKIGTVSEPPPLAAMEKIAEVVRKNTPDVFDDGVAETVTTTPRQKPVSEVVANSVTYAEKQSEVELPPDPISGVDPAKADQVARAGNINKIWGVARKIENAAKNVERAEKTAKTLAKYIEPVLDWLAKFNG